VPWLSTTAQVSVGSGQGVKGTHDGFWTQTGTASVGEAATGSMSQNGGDPPASVAGAAHALSQQ
jgi:hypothetical protein